MSHAEIARRVNDQIGQGWWAQTVALRYERIRGLRDVGQDWPDGTDVVVLE